MHVGIGFDLFESFAPIHTGHVQIEENDTGTRRFRCIGVGSPMKQVVQKFFAIAHANEIIEQFSLLQSFPREQNVIFIIIRH